MLVGGLPPTGGDRDHHDVHQAVRLPVGERRQVGETGLLLRLPAGDGRRVALAGVGVPADLQPALHPLVPAQQHPAGRRVQHQRTR